MPILDRNLYVTLCRDLDCAREEWAKALERDPEPSGNREVDYERRRPIRKAAAEMRRVRAALAGPLWYARAGWFVNGLVVGALVIALSHRC